MRRRISRRRFLVRGGLAALGTGFAGSLLAGCGGGGEGAPGELSLWSNLEEDGQAYFPDNIERPFEEANPGVDLAVTYQPPDNLDRLVRIAMQGGQGPDLVPTPGPAYAGDYVDADLFADLEGYARRYGWGEKMLGWALDLGRFGEKLFLIPNQFQTMLLFYNKTVMEREGWGVPENREEFEAVAEEAMGREIVPFAAGIGDEPAALEWFPTVFWNHYSGPQALYEALTGETPFTDPIFVEAIALFKRYVDNGWFGGSPQRFFSNGFDALHADFGAGGAAMNVEGSWLMANIGEFFGEAAGNENDWDWAPLPPLRDGVPAELYELGIGSTISVNSRSDNPDDAARFIDFLFADKERAARWMADVPSAFNVPIPLEQSDFPADMDGRVARHLAVLSQATERGNFGYTAWTFWPAKSEVYVYEELQKVLTGSMTPAEYCAGLDEVFKEDLQEGEVPPIIEPRRNA